MTTALLLIDIQEGMWMEDEKPHRGEAMLKNAAALLAKARKAGAPVIFVQHDGGPGDTLEKGTKGFAIRPEIGRASCRERVSKQV